jgi:hypothetical protein
MRRHAGHALVMTSNPLGWGAQHFYRKMGYRGAGCLILDGTPLSAAR